MDAGRRLVLVTTWWWTIMFSLMSIDHFGRAGGAIGSAVTQIDANQDCEPMSITCSCGAPSTPAHVVADVRIRLQTCYDDQLESCELCDGQTMDKACALYEGCETCGEGLNRCLTCPPFRHGKWCRQVCDCRNDGACHPNDGSCLCPRGFSGSRCEFAVHKDADDRSRLFRRQIANSVSCPVLPAPSNGEIHSEATAPTLNDAVKYTCKETYTMIGSSARHCLRTGQWAGEAPTCEKLCAYPVVDPYVKVAINPERAGAPLLTTLGNEVLAELIFSCESGFVLVGSPRMRCASGVWDQVPPKCVADPECTDPGDPQNGDRFVVRGPIRASYKTGTQLFFNCTDDGHTLVGAANITCMPFSQWSAPLPLCVPNVVSNCVYECNTASASILKVVERPLICSLESHTDAHVILRPRTEDVGGNT